MMDSPPGAGRAVDAGGEGLPPRRMLEPGLGHASTEEVDTPGKNSHQNPSSTLGNTASVADKNAIGDTIAAFNSSNEPKAREPVSLLMENLLAVWADVRGIVSDEVELVGLETRRVGHSLNAMFMYGTAVGLLLVSAWLGLLAAMVFWFHEHGIAASSAILLAVLLNVILAFLCWRAIRRRSRELRFQAVVDSLRGRGSNA